MRTERDAHRMQRAVQHARGVWTVLLVLFLWTTAVTALPGRPPSGVPW
jgi:hypothetical protein